MATTKSTATVRKPTKAQSRKIEERAYQRFVARGYDHGHDVEDWLQAESEVMADVVSKTPAARPAAPKATDSKSRRKSAA